MADLLNKIVPDIQFLTTINLNILLLDLNFHNNYTKQLIISRQLIVHSLHKEDIILLDLIQYRIQMYIQFL